MSETKAKIDFPCEWTYTLIGLEVEKIKQAVKEIFTNKSVVVSVSKKSSTGKYTSMNVSTNVKCREERDRFFMELKDHVAVKLVL